MVYANASGTVPNGIVIEYDVDDFTIVRRTVGDRTFFGIEGAEIPVNYVPLIIEISLTNSANLETMATLTILPGEYVTATLSENTGGGYPVAGAYSHPTGTTGNGSYGSNSTDGNGATGQTNFNFYEINITAVPDFEILVGNVRRKIMIGDPTIESESPFTAANTPAEWQGAEYRRTAPDKHHIVSPSFIIASQRGITSTGSNWTTGQERCRRYRESQYPAGTWRAPTFAELAMLAVMQNDPNSAIKSLFNAGTGYWFTGLEAYRIQVGNYGYDDPGVGRTGTAVANGGSAAIRCVRDTWKVYPQDSYGDYGD
jgi:hypothetical protein